MSRHGIKLVIGLLTVAAVTVPAAPAHAVAALNVNLRFPDPTTVGQSNLPASVRVDNLSNAGESISLTSLSITPSCGSIGGGFCQAPDTNVFALPSTATGSAGTACAGVVFSLSAPDPSGRSTLMPSSPIALSSTPGPTSFCQIDFTVSVSRTPSVDTSPGSPGLQTIASATALGTISGTSNQVQGLGQITVTVLRANPSLVTRASLGGPVGTQVTDTATLSGGQNPTGTITFKLYGPGDLACASPAVFTSAPKPIANATATSEPFTPTTAGTYRWVATYSGDANNSPVTNPCNDPNENVTITRPAPPADTTPPRVIGTVPAAGATGISPRANIKATFSEAMKASTINGATFKLFKKGSTTKVRATITYDATTHRGTLNPVTALRRGATYKAVVTTFAQDVAGNRLDQSATSTGLQQKVWLFRVRR